MIGSYKPASNARRARYIKKAMLLAFTLAMLPVINGCSQPPADPSKQTIPTNSDQWQKKLGDTFELLPEGDRKLQNR